MENEVSFDRRPIPDPTVLTTQQLVREIAALKEIIGTRLDGMDKAIDLLHDSAAIVPSEVDVKINHLKELHGVRFSETNVEIRTVEKAIMMRIDGMDRAVVLLQTIADRVPPLIDEKIAGLEGIHNEKFNSIATQFRERDVRTEQSSKDSKVAVDAALQAAKEAVGEQNKSSALAIAKSEAATTKQIDQIQQFIGSGNKATDDKIDDIKERLTRIEGTAEGTTATKHDNTQGNQWAVGLAVVVAVAVIEVAVRLIK